MVKNMNIIKLSVLVLSLFSSVASSARFPSDVERHITVGKQHYDSFVQKYGKCWKTAVEDLHDRCHHLSEDVQQNIALLFTNCFLQKSSNEVYDCHRSVGLKRKECLQGMSERAFNAYTHFYTHTHDLCFYLKSQVWHEETEDTINRLSFASDKAADQLEDLVDNSLNLKQALVDSHMNLKTMMDDFQIAALEQRKLIFDVFDRLSSLQEWAIGEISWLDTVVFYLCGVIVSHILTATPRTQSARFFLFLAFTTNIIVERFLCKYFLENSVERIDTLNENLSWWIWVSRKILVTVCITILSVSILKYQDYNIINHQLLVQIQQQNLKLLGHLERVKMLEGSVLSTVQKDTEITMDSDCEVLGEFTPQRIKTEAVPSPSKLPISPRTTAAVLRKTEAVIQSALENSMNHLDIVHRTPTRSVSPALSRISTRSTTSTSSQHRKRLEYNEPGAARTRYNLRSPRIAVGN